MRAARDFLLAHREDYDTAYREFRWPAVDQFNWALDWFDALAAEGGERLALWIVEEDGSECRRSFAELSARSNQVANWLRDHGVRRGDRMIVMLGNQVELWETDAGGDEARRRDHPCDPAAGSQRPRRPRRARRRPPRGRERARRREVRRRARRLHAHRRRRAGRRVAALRRRDRAATAFTPDGPTAASDPLLLYFTSGTTDKPKLVEHSHVSYPVGHLSTMYWAGIQPGDVHLNVSSPGWGKHAWSNVYAPWIAEATVMVFNYTRFDAQGAARPDRPLRRDHVLRAADGVADADPGGPRALAGAAARGAVRRRAAEPRGDRAGPAQVAASPSATATGRPRPRPRSATRRASRSSPARWAVRCPAIASRCSTRQTGEPADEGEIAIDLAQRPAGPDDGLPRRHGELPRRRRAARTTARATSPHCDADGYFTCVGRADDLFKASDYLISPFELESVLMEHEAVAEAAVVPVARPDAPRAAQGLRDARARPRADASDGAARSCASRAIASPRTSASAG